jgi:hypothetical protein
MSSVLARRVAWLGLAILGLRLVAWLILGWGVSEPLPADLLVPLTPPAAPAGLAAALEEASSELALKPVFGKLSVVDDLFMVRDNEPEPGYPSPETMGELEVLFSSAPVDTSISESIASHDRSTKKKLYSMDAELDKRRKNKTGGRKQQTGSGSGGGSDSDGWSNQAVPAPLSIYTPLNRQARTSDGIVRAFGGDHTSNVGSSGGGVASVARRADLGGARGDGLGNADGGSETTAGFCAEERQQHAAQWAHAREHLYVDYAVAANQPTSSGGTWLLRRHASRTDQW